MTARDVLDALARKHQADVFVPECRYRESGFGGRLIDAWAMKRSWARFDTVGYEIKVSRSDFTRDTKWQEYLPYCHRFYFACPKGLIHPDELPKGIGLIYVGAGGAYTRVTAHRRSQTRDADILAVLRYVAMWRSEIVPSETKEARMRRFRVEYECRRSTLSNGRAFRHRIAQRLAEAEEKAFSLELKVKLLKQDLHFAQVRLIEAEKYAHHGAHP